MSGKLSPVTARVAAATLILPAAANTLSHLITPISGSHLSGQLAQVAAHPDRAEAAAVLQFLLPISAIGVLLLAVKAVAGSRRLAWIGGSLLAGFFLLSPLGTAQGLVEAVVSHHAGAAQAYSIVHAYNGSVVNGLGSATLLLQAAGLLTLGFALYRSQAVPRWVALGWVVTLPMQVLTHSGNGDQLPALSWGFFTAVTVASAISWIGEAGRSHHTLSPEAPSVIMAQ